MVKMEDGSEYEGSMKYENVPGLPAMGAQDGYIRYPDKHIETGGVCEACQKRQAITDQEDYEGDGLSGQRILHPVCANCAKKRIDWQGLFTNAPPKEQVRRGFKLDHGGGI